MFWLVSRKFVMVPVVCRVKHDPDAGTYGDCLRACVASIMELDAEDVPHFADGDPSGPDVFDQLRQWLNARDYFPFFMGLSGDISLSELLAQQGELHPEIYYILTGNVGDGDHCVVCKGGAIVHNPSWIASPLTGPPSNGFWNILVLMRQ
jgi:hypothetical protein